MAISLNLLGKKNSQVIGGAIPKDYLRLFKEDLENSQKLMRLLNELINSKKGSIQGLKRDLRVAEIIINLAHKYFDELENRNLVDEFLLKQAERIIMTDFSKLQDIKTSRKSIVEKYQDLYFVVVDLTSALETTVNYLKRLNRW